jgi:hypothetical protein
MGETLTKEELKAAYDGFKKIRKKDWKKEEWIKKDVKAENPKNQYICNYGEITFYGSDWLYDINNGLGEWELFEEEPIETNGIPMIVKNLPEDIRRIVHEYARSENRKINEDDPIIACFGFDKTPEKYLIWNDVTSGNYESFYNFRIERQRNYDDLNPLLKIQEGDIVKFIGPETTSVSIKFRSFPIVNGLSSYIHYLSHISYNTEYTVGHTYTHGSITIVTKDGQTLIMPPTCFKLVRKKENKVEPSKSVAIEEAKLEKVQYKVGDYVSFVCSTFNNVPVIGKVVESDERTPYDLYKVEIKNINHASGFHNIVSIYVYDDNDAEMQCSVLHKYQLQQFKEHVHCHYPFLPINDVDFYLHHNPITGLLEYVYKPTGKPIFTGENCLNLDNILTASTMFKPINNNSQNKTQENEENVIQIKQQENLVFSKTQKKKNKLQLTPIKTLNY